MVSNSLEAVGRDGAARKLGKYANGKFANVLMANLQMVFRILGGG